MSSGFATKLREPCIGALVAGVLALGLGGVLDGAHADPMTVAQANAAATPPADAAAAPPVDTPPREPLLFDSGKFLATGGVSQIEGAGGGGLVPWALITGYGTRDAIGANVHDTQIFLRDYQLNSTGAAIGLYDRVELSYDHLWFDTRSTGRLLGIGNGYTFQENVLGAKVRLVGDAVYDQDSWLPQLAAGVQYKFTDSTAILKAVGARDTDGTDFYLAATKLLLGESLLLDATLRFTRANQLGILGYGGDKSDAYHPEFEGSAAYLFSRELALGAEYRTKPDNLGFAREQPAYDMFLAYFFNKNLSATLAYLDLGDIATRNNENGVYLSVQIGF
jgi:Protein of unknown function (DUF3034)